MDTTASRGGVDGPAAPPAEPARLRVEVESMPDGRTIRYYAAAPHVRDPRGSSPEDRAHGAQPR